MPTVQEKLHEALKLLQEALDLSVESFAKGADKRAIGAVWSTFLTEFFDAIKQKSKESKENLLQFVRLPRM
ncbi:MAG: hypothetical protein OWT28_06290 [Firmicutes bacterium]|nr:hypothetical protein [Bacillota bacterium]